MIVFHLMDREGEIVKTFGSKDDAYEYQNRIRPDTVIRMERVEIANA